MVATNVSRVWLLFGVCPQMLHDVRSAAEGFFAHFTLTGFPLVCVVAGVTRLDLLLKVCPHTQHRRGFSMVCPCMSHQTRPHVALVSCRLLSGVCPGMFHQNRSGTEGCPTHTAPVCVLVSLTQVDLCLKVFPHTLHR